MQTKITDIGKTVLAKEAHALEVISKRLSNSFTEAVKLLYNTKGKVVLSGVGKSGIVAKKIVATLSSTGTFSVFIHPVEALHGDMGMIAPEDVIIIISHGGETPELNTFAHLIRKRGHKIIVITAHPDSSLGKTGDIVIETYVTEEACAACTTFNLAPTTSAIVSLALGDAIASALQEVKGITIEHFAHMHPAGRLGKLASG
ncbi:MAG: hypothetical protein COV10_04300 [Candidatus Vogelbacteria bacterium CG10_big_fil_rev_8_21_14_0_10_51_16]|uniref:SIS domain-containing protein n=1 Tax=Candidatus Vogelbacteria bacterium CG10_big_fil_rev_8_21_14_0_10_51_16 TaxID=1975045 RepID=A0A2H0RDC8_9BACT|nr:MAG: hypothetical protein COV10_04300 [Candidatus Vogelbacteria bacterium CG10_big_fil_rev_8_21_14_0_10_51_16]